MIAQALPVDAQFRQLVQLILQHGVTKTDRTGTGTLSVHGVQMRYDLQQGFPLLGLKHTYFPAVVHELLWFLNAMDEPYLSRFGNTNIRYLEDHNVRIWSDWPYARYVKASPEGLPVLTYEEFRERIRQDDAFALDFGNLGPVYGKQWVDWRGANQVGINQLDVAVGQLRTRPDDRGIVVNAWNVTDLPQMALRPCHTMFQLLTRPDKQSPSGYTLDLHLYQRSADTMLGVPFNVASYALLLHMFSEVSGHQPGEFIHTLGDAHIYLNHVEGAQELLLREDTPMPSLHLTQGAQSLDDFRFQDIQLQNYQHRGRLPLVVAV